MNDGRDDRYVDRGTDQLDIVVRHRCVDDHAPSAVTLCILGDDRRADAIGDAAADADKNRHRRHVDDRLGDHLLRRKRIDRQDRVCVAAADDRDIGRKNDGLNPFSHDHDPFCFIDLLRHFQIFRSQLSCNSRQFFLVHMSSSSSDFIYIYPR